MMTWTIIATQSEEAWLDDLITDVIQNDPPSLPPHDCKIGHVECYWEQVAPGLVYVAANPETGTAEDKWYAMEVLMSQLRTSGFKRVTSVLMPDHITKLATWQDVMDKAKRLVQSGAVSLDANGRKYTTGTVKGDHGTYPIEIYRQDPNNPNQVSYKTCGCDWGQFMNLPRTRQWKKFEFPTPTPCSHLIAANWVAQSVPWDEDRAPGNPTMEGQQPGQMSLFDMSGGQAPSSMGLMQRSPMPNPNAWFNQPGAPQQNAAPLGNQGGGGAPPPPESVLPQFPMGEPMELPPVNPASTPGGRPGPTPTNPLQYPGGTFSSVRESMGAEQFKNGDWVQIKEEDPVNPGTLQGRNERGLVGPTTIPKNAIGQVMGTDSLGLVEVLWMGQGFDANGECQPFGVTQWFWPSQLIPRPDIYKLH